MTRPRRNDVVAKQACDFFEVESCSPDIAVTGGAALGLNGAAVAVIHQIERMHMRQGELAGRWFDRFDCLKFSACVHLFVSLIQVPRARGLLVILMNLPPGRMKS